MMWKSLAWMAVAAAAGIVVAGFWNVGFVDGLGLSMFVAPTIGPFEGLGHQFDSLGHRFGFLFAVVTGLATTFTASNCAAFAMLPALTFSARGRRSEGLRLGSITALSAALVASVYGAFVGRLGTEGITTFNTPAIRSAQSLAVFGAIGAFMIVWALAESGFAGRRAGSSFPAIRERSRLPADVRALISGLLIGAFTVGRPLAVFRELLVYAAQPSRVRYGASILAVEAIGAVLILLAALVLLTFLGGQAIERWRQRAPEATARVSAAALTAGGTFLIFYWGVSRVWPMFGRWGFKLGIYG